MNLIILKKVTKEDVIQGVLLSETVLGDISDSSNAEISASSTEWDSGKTDYTIGTVVYHAGFWKEYTCLKANTTEVPLPKATGVDRDWIESGTRAEYAYRDNAPTRMSYGQVDQDLVLDAKLDLATNYLFIQNLKNVKMVKVEGVNLAGEVVKTIIDKEMEKILTFQKYNCCSITYATETFIAQKLEGCTTYQDIKITLTPQIGKRAMVGSACVGKAWDIGCLKEYPNLTPKSTAKFELKDIGFELNTGAKYIDGKVSTFMERGRENEIDLILMENVGELVGFDINEFPTKNITKFLGFYKQAPMTPEQTYQKISLDLYGIPSVRKE